MGMTLEASWSLRHFVLVLGELALAVAVSGNVAVAATRPDPRPIGRLVDLGGHRLHVTCTGAGKPTVVVENGLGDFSFDWLLVQRKVSSFTRICTYDRAGYAWSDPGPKPRSFAQLNLELHDALSKLGEPYPLVLVGHSFGGPVVRNFAAIYPEDVAGMVLVDAAFEGQRVGIGGKRTMRLGEGAKGVSIPEPRENMRATDKPAVHNVDTLHEPQRLDRIYDHLPPAVQKLQIWAQSRPQTDEAEISQREWASEYFAKMLSTSQAGTLRAMPLVVLTRAEGGYGNDLDVPGPQLDKERMDGQAKLALLSSRGKQIIVHSGHNMELEVPDDVANAIHGVVDAVRRAWNQ